MVSSQTPISANQRNTIQEFENSCKKRKWEEREEKQENYEKGSKLSKVENSKSSSLFDMKFHLEKPLPLEWQQCLDIQSGQIHFYNTRTQKRTCKDPRQSPERLSPGPMSLDLELNLPNESFRTHMDDNWEKCDLNHPSNAPSKDYVRQTENSGGLTCCPSWMSFEVDHQEMVAAVCTRCHMLVMLCKSSPACPNCKFIYPPDQSPPNLFKPKFKLLCCKD